MFRQCFVVSSCLLAGRSAVRWADWDVQTVFCGEQCRRQRIVKVDIEMIENIGTIFVFVPIVSNVGLLKKRNKSEVFFSHEFEKNFSFGAYL
jgi:hypothetical protein